MVATDLTSRALADARPISFWLDDPARPAPLPKLHGTRRADLAIVGGGFTGLWAAVEARERDPDRDVVLLEADRIGGAATGRNGGFLSSSLTHGLANGAARFPDEIDEIERQAMANFEGIAEAVDRYGIDAEYERRPEIALARRPHQAAWFPEAVELAARFGQRVDVVEGEALQEIVRSPVVIAGLRHHDGQALVHPAKLAWGLRDAALGLGVEIHEGSPVTAIEPMAGGLRVVAGAGETGEVVADRVLLATNGFPPLVRSIRRYVVPVFDHALMTEPLTAEQREAVGWHGREGLADATNRFHYFRLSADDRILWGGYDATYHWRGGVDPRFDQDDEVHERLARHFFEFFPQLEGIRFSHRWGGVIDTCSRFSVMFGTAHEGRLAYAVGYTGLGVGSTRFGARTALDLVDGLDTERTRLSMVRRRPVPFPPEPFRWPGIRLTTAAMGRADRTGREGLWLKLLDRLGLGFQS
jgi:glycine/D-amino acid oxidase-like deaminating enzyme